MGNAKALITGASTGIGRSFAFRFAQEGYDLILLARNENQLRLVAEEISNKYNQSVEIITCDLSTVENIELMEKKLTACDNIAVLVNNAGFGLQGSFSESSTEKLQRMINLHVTAVTRLTRAVLPSMVRNNRGVIINVSSLSALIAIPNNMLYSATKSFINTFTEHLRIELQGKNIQVQALCPSFTRTEFYNTDEYREKDDSRIPNFLWMTSDQVVEQSIRALGKGSVVYVPGTMNQIAARFGKLSSLFFQKKIS